MNFVDVVAGIVLLIGSLNGAAKGFLKGIISFLSVFCGVFVGLKFMGYAVALLGDMKGVNPRIIPYIAFAIVFILTSSLISILGKMVKPAEDSAIYSGLDQALGGFLGLLKTSFMISVLFWICDSVELNGWYIEKSVVYPYLAPIAPKIAGWISHIVPVGDFF